jgi:16S rRNA (cytidine1402-2'-O)-methyltransferase
MSKPPVKTPERKNKSSPDYPLLARQWVEMLQASGDAAISKLPPALYVVATPIGHLGDISLRALVTLLSVDSIACEDTRTSGGMLAKYGIKKPLVSYHDHNATEAGPKLLALIASGHAVALVSDAGMPLVSDPGYRLVRDCIEAGHEVVVIPGANAALTALAGSGLPTDRFHFAGFLPPKSAARQSAIAELKNIAATLIIHEAPQRLAGSLKDLAKVLGDNRNAAVARELTKLFEETKRGTLAELAEFYRQQDIKGEIVIIIGPPDIVQTTEQDLDVLLKDHLRTLSVRDAVTAVGALTGAKKSAIYARALWLAGKNGR